MQSIRQIYKIGRGPSSSHTMGPMFAAQEFLRRVPDAERYVVTLFGSLAKTGRGHGTDTVLRRCFAPRDCEIRLQPDAEGLPHENTMRFQAFCGDRCVGELTALSVGGGDVEFFGEQPQRQREIYAENSFEAVAARCRAEGIRLPDYVFAHEPDLPAYLQQVWNTMRDAAHRGVQRSGTLPGGLGVSRRAAALYNGRPQTEDAATHENRLVCAYAFAISEENADNGLIVTAPTCGACGVVPAVLLYMQQKYGLPDERIVAALAAGGLVGNLVKQNASISGAECGCQAEIGTACSMAAAALTELQGMELGQIEYAAEVALEHHLGLTCDPIRGLVQIPCIERNAVAAMRTINAASLARFLSDSRKISFDLVVRTMYETGRAMHAAFRETAEGGLALLYEQPDGAPRSGMD